MEGSPSPSALPNWASLPPELVHLISEKVKSIVDYVRFRAVCSPWRSASLPMPRHLPPQLPWLLRWVFPREENKGTHLCYDLWESKTRKLHLPETSDMQCYASYRGWLMFVSAEGSQVLVLNPLTRTRIHLPSFTTTPKNLEGEEYHEDYWYMPEKVTFSADPTDPNCLITVFLWKWIGVVYCLVGDPCWTWVTEYPVHFKELVDAAYCEGRYYMLFEDGIQIMDSNNPEEMVFYDFEPELGVDFEPEFLLEGKSGVYVVVVHPAAHDTIGLYQLEEQPLKLKQVADTSNKVLFKEATWLTVCPDDWDLINGGSLYTMEYSVVVENQIGCYTIFFRKLDDGKYKPVVRKLSRELRMEGIPPIWFQPSFV